MKTALAWASFMLAAMLALDIHFHVERFVEAKIKNDSAIARDTERLAVAFERLVGVPPAPKVIELSAEEIDFLLRGHSSVEEMRGASKRRF